MVIKMEKQTKKDEAGEKLNTWNKKNLMKYLPVRDEQ